MNYRDATADFSERIAIVTVIPCRVLLDHEGVLPLTPSRRGSRTREVEVQCGLPPSRYFYAGRADRQYGDIALAYRPSLETGHTGSANPFDSGDVYHQEINPVRFDLERAIRLIRETLVSLSEWRREFVEFLRAYFPRLQAYFSGTPARDGDWGPPDLPARHPNDHWRTWTWEVRLYEEHPVSQHLQAWAVTEHGYQTLTMARISGALPPLGGVDHPLDELLRRRPLLDIDPCGRLEREVQNESLEIS